MRDAEVARDLDGIGRLVEAVAADLHGEGGDVRVDPGSHGGEQAGVEAARQEHAERHVGDTLPLDGALQQGV